MILRRRLYNKIKEILVFRNGYWRQTTICFRKADESSDDAWRTPKIQQKIWERNRSGQFTSPRPRSEGRYRKPTRPAPVGTACWPARPSLTAMASTWSQDEYVGDGHIASLSAITGSGSVLKLTDRRIGRLVGRAMPRLVSIDDASAIPRILIPKTGLIAFYVNDFLCVRGGGDV